MINNFHETHDKEEQPNQDFEAKGLTRWTAAALLASSALLMVGAAKCNALAPPEYGSEDKGVTQLYDINGYDIIGNGADSRDN